jgi:pimeloyl-ACP methyl ester carboxylesterase
MANLSAKRIPEPAAALEVVDPRWLLKALGLTIAAAAVLSYFSLCLLIYQGSWQLFLHPSTKIDVTPHIAFQALRFDSAATGTPRLSGWWIPAGSPSTRTVLFLHDGDGSLSSCVPKLDLLHNSGANIFAFDYRGFGQSDGPHPNEVSMTEDSAAALDYLINTRHLYSQQIVVYGEGLAAPLAAHLANSHALPAMILDNPDPDAFVRAVSGKKSALLPMKLLVRERFDVRSELAVSNAAKLLFANSPLPGKEDHVGENQTMFKSATGAKMTVTFGKLNSDQAYVQSVTRFLDEYLP